MRYTCVAAALLTFALFLFACTPSVRPATPGTATPEGTSQDRSPAVTGGPDPVFSRVSGSQGDSGTDGSIWGESGSAVLPAGDCLIWARSLPQASLMDPVLSWSMPRYVTEGTCRLPVHSEEVTVDLVLPPSADPAAAEAALQVTGAEAHVAWTTDPSGEHLFTVRFPAGEPGERLTVRLLGPFGPAGEQVDLGFDLERVTTPRVLLEYRDESGEWVPVKPGSTLPHRPLDLRFISVGGADLAEVAERLAQQGVAAERRAGTLTVHLDDPPARMALDLNRVAADHGLVTCRSFIEFFTGEEPHLSLLDPTTGQEQVIGEAPVNVYATLVAPAGDQVALMASDPVDPYGTQIWVLDVTAGDLHLTGITPSSPWYRAYWRQGELVVADHDRVHRWSQEAAQATVQPSRGRAFTVLSPDGRLLAGIAFDMAEEDESGLAPASIVLIDLETGAERILADRQIRVRIVHGESETRLDLAFSPDGSGLLIREPTPVPGNWRYLRLDIASDSLEEVPAPPDAAQRQWVPGPNGLAYRIQEQPYGDVVVRTAGGTERQCGSGHVAGWLPDGRLLLIRWANGQWLRRPWFL